MMTDAESANITQWDGRKGHYEVYFLKFNHVRTSTGFWIRYTLLAPLNGSPIAELWAIFFDANDPSKNNAVKNTFPVSRVVVKKDVFFLGIGDALMTHTGAHGRITGDDGSMSWDLRFDPVAGLYRHFPADWMYRAPLPSTKVVSPNFSIKVYGSIEVNGKIYNCDGEPGQQSHLWGTKHAAQWTWANATLFSEDETAIFECLSARINIGSLLSPALTLFFLRYKGKDYYLNGLISLLRNSVDGSLPAWRFHSGYHALRLSGEIRAPLESFIGVEYTDPDGAKLWCYNTEVATLHLEVDVPGTKTGTLTSPGFSALEFVSRSRDPRVRIRL